MPGSERILRTAVNGMIKTFLLIVTPARTWDGILRTQKTIGFVFVTHLLPLLMISCASEGFGLGHWGKMQGEVPHLVRFTPGEALVFEILE